MLWHNLVKGMSKLVIGAKTDAQRLRLTKIHLNMMNKTFSTEIRESQSGKYLKVFMLDDAKAVDLQNLLSNLNEVKKVNITDSQSISHKGNTLTIYPKPMVSIETLDDVVNTTLDRYNSGIVIVTTEAITDVKFKDIENRIINVLEKAQATIDVSVAWFTNFTLQEKLLERQKAGCKIRIMIDANHTNQKHGVDLSPFEHIAVKAERKGIMHCKFCVIDNNIVIHGSYNWTTNAETKNDEEISVHINDVKMASQYTREFNRVWDKGKHEYMQNAKLHHEV